MSSNSLKGERKKGDKGHLSISEPFNFRTYTTLILNWTTTQTRKPFTKTLNWTKSLNAETPFSFGTRCDHCAQPLLLGLGRLDGRFLCIQKTKTFKKRKEKNSYFNECLGRLDGRFLCIKKKGHSKKEKKKTHILMNALDALMVGCILRRHS